MHINLLLSLVSATTQHVLHIAATQQLSKVYANKIAYGFLFYYFAPCKFPLILEKESYYSLFLLASAPASSVEATNAKVKAKLRLCPLLSTWDDLDLGKKAAPKLFMHRIPIKNSISFSSSSSTHMSETVELLMLISKGQRSKKWWKSFYIFQA